MLTKVLLRSISDTFQLNLTKYSSNWVYAYNKVFFSFLLMPRFFPNYCFWFIRSHCFFRDIPQLCWFLFLSLFFLLYYLHIKKLKLNMHYIVFCSFSFAFFKNTLNIKDHIRKYKKTCFCIRWFAILYKFTINEKK